MSKNPKKTFKKAIGLTELQVLADIEEINPVWLKAKSKIPAGVVQPSGDPTSDTGSMTGKELYSGISSYSGQEWKSSPEYAEICYRLITWTVQELVDDNIKVPQWKVQP